MQAERHEDEPRDVRGNGAEVLQPPPGPEAHDVEAHREPERAEGRGQHVAPVAFQSRAAPTEGVRPDDGGGHQEVRVVEDVVDPVTPSAQKAVAFPELPFGPEIDPAFVGVA
jgi:hypothetical protein